MWSQQGEERRQWRSHDRAEALHLQLVYAAERFDFDAFVLADGDGELVASSTSTEAGEQIARVLATFGPMLRDERSGAERAQLAARWLEEELEGLGLGWAREEITAREFFAEGELLILLAVGGTRRIELMREVGMHRVIFGVRRIWAETARQAA